MAVTHADLAPSPPSSDLGSKTGAFLMVLSIFFGLICFILCLIAEVTRSQVTWMRPDDECVYSGSGKLPLSCAAGAFFALALAMVIEHTFMLIAASKSPSSPLNNWDPDSDFFKTLTWQACFFFISTWISFAVGEILLLIGVCVESGHLKNWATPRPNCIIIREGLFTAAGVLGLVTVFLAAGLYITALSAQKFVEDQENVRREVLQTSALFANATPPRTPTRNVIRAVASENTVSRQDQNQHSLADYLTEFEKYSNLI